MQILQVNNNNSSLAHELLEQMAAKNKIDIICVQEPYKVNKSWISSIDQRATILIRNKNIKIPENRKIIGYFYSGIKLDYLTLINIYITPNCSIDEFEACMEEIIENRRNWKDPLILLGDLNARSRHFGDSTDSPREIMLSDTIFEMRLIPMDIAGGSYTFHRRKSRSKIDIISASRKLLNKISSRIDHEYNGSDHKTCIHVIDLSGDVRYKRVMKHNTDWVWNTKTFDADKFLKEYNKLNMHIHWDNLNKKSIDIYYKNIITACNLTMKKRFKNYEHKENPWWTEEIAELRSQTVKARRRWQQAKSHNRETVLAKKETYKELKKKLIFKINDSKKELWSSFVALLETDIWGRPFQVIRNKYKSSLPPPVVESKEAKKIIRSLFPQELNTIRYDAKDLTKNSITVSKSDIWDIAHDLEVKKAVGLDKVPPGLIKFIIENDLDKFTKIMNACLELHYIPKKWKKTRVILLRKSNEETMVPSNFRPICIGNSVNKVMERILEKKIYEQLDTSAFHHNQYGFSKSKSTLDALKIITEHIRHNNGKEKFGILIGLDVRNAFNSLAWNNIFESLKKRKFPEHLQNLIQLYFKDRFVEYKAADKWIKIKIKKGVLQGSVISPIIWNIIYDDLLKLNFGDIVNVIAYADDIAVFAADNNLYKVKT